MRHDGTLVNDVELPPWAKSHADFVEKLSIAIESDYVSKHLNRWIDLIFGCKQRGKAAEAANNLFYHLCYEGSVDLDQVFDLEQRYALEVQIGEFGQVPKQIFTSPHPERLLPNKISLDEADVDCNALPASIHRLNESVDVIKYWKHDMTGMKMICDYKVHQEPLSSVAMSVDNLWVFSSSHDSKLRMYSVEEMQIVRSVPLGDKINISCCFPMPNNKTVLIGSWDHSICAYSVEYGKTFTHNEAHRYLSQETCFKRA